jgi:hypothetical protein
MRTLPSASVISSSETLESDTKSISVFSLRKSMESPTTVVKQGANLQQIRPKKRHLQLFVGKPARPNMGSAPLRSLKTPDSGWENGGGALTLRPPKTASRPF